jgi:hypothetical protein
MSDFLDKAREGARARADKAQRTADESAKVWAEKAAEARSVDEKTARLKALRLEKERADAAAAETSKPATAPKPRARVKKAISN